MEDSNQQSLVNNDVLSRKSWTAYIGPIVLTSVLSGLILFIDPLLAYVGALPLVSGWNVNYIIGFQLNSVLLLIPFPFSVLLIAPFIYIVYQSMLIRSYLLFVDPNGVWVKSGIFPWSKGIGGVKWRDLDEAVYTTGFVSWLLRSHTIKISHRFTKASEIRLTHMSNAKSTVPTINSTLSRKSPSDE